MKLPPQPELEPYRNSRTMKQVPSHLVSRCNYESNVPAELWLSRDYMAQIYHPSPRTPIRITVNRTRLAGIKRTPRGPYPIWKDGISWDELMRVKREVGYGAFDAVEIYPRDEDIVDVAAMRHLWIVPKHFIPFAWRKKPAETTTP